MSSNDDGINTVPYVSDVLYFVSVPSPVPLPYMYCYHGGTRYLSTSLPTLKHSTKTEVDSAYCPQCLYSWDAAAAFSIAKGQCCVLDKVSSETKIGCIKCPECFSVLASSVTKNECIQATPTNSNLSHVIMYECGYCRWSSDECGVYRFLNIDESMDVNSIIEQANKEVQALMSQKLNCGNDDVFNDILLEWNEKVIEEEKTRRRNESLFHAQSRKSVIANKIFLNEEKKDITLPTSIKSLDERIQNRCKLINHLLAQDIVKNVSTMKIPPDDFYGIGSNSIPLYGPFQQAENYTILSSNHKGSPLPSHVHLRARSTRRSCEDQKLGRPGILIKPKMNPLEGDTSLRYGQGQWWKKDSSAAHSVPRVMIKASQKNVSTGSIAFLLRVKNQSLGPIKMRIHLNFEDGMSLSRTYSNVIINPNSLETSSVEVISATKSSDVMDTFTLDGIEDSLLDGGSSAKFRSSSWYSKSIDWTGDNSTKLIHLEKDSAWFEFIVKETISKVPFIASPLLMDVERGEGSWESSMCPKKTTSECQKDFVSFILLPTWKSKQNNMTVM